MLLQYLLEDDSKESPGASSDFWYNELSGAAAVGGGSNAALRQSAVYVCTKVLSETLAMLPLKLYRRLPDGGREEATDHPLYEIIHDAPNPRNTSFEWRENMHTSHLLRGNGYSRIIEGRRGAVESLEPLPPGAVKPVLLPTGRVRYEYTEGGKVHILSQDEVLHVRGLGDSVQGYSVIALHAQTIGTALSTDNYAGNVFKNGARPAGFIQMPGTINKEQAAAFREEWHKAYGGSKNAGKTAVLEGGMEWKPISMDNKDAQFIESREYNVRDICRIFRVPPHLAGDLTDATFSNIEQQSLEFIMYTMYPHFKRWEQAIARDLVQDPEYFAEFNFDALLRGDAASRGALYNNGIMGGWLTRNEVRRKENLNPLPKLDEPLQPLNMVPAGQEPAQTSPQRGSNPTAIAAMAKVIAQDAAARIVGCEKRELAKALKGTSDPAGAADVVAAFYKQQAGYFRQALNPVVGIAACTGLASAIGIEEGLANYIGSQKLHFAQSNDSMAFIGWLETYSAQALENIIMGALGL